VCQGFFCQIPLFPLAERGHGFRGTTFCLGSASLFEVVVGNPM
jgi:hypothetical protein